MASLVLELQYAAADESASIAELLRKARLIATKLGQAEFETWAKLELDGYRDDAELPPYRLLNCSVQAFNPMQGRWIPVIFQENLPGLTTAPVKQGIAEIKHLVESGQGTLQMPFSSATTHRLMQSLDVPLEPKRIISRVGLVGILEGVRNRIIDFTVQLEREGILGDGLQFTQKEKRAAQHVTFHQVFGGNVGNVSNVSNSENVNVSQNAKLNGTDYRLISEAVGAIKAIASKDSIGGEAGDDLRGAIATVESQLHLKNPDEGIVRRGLALMMRASERIGTSFAGQKLAEHWGTIAEFAAKAL